MKILCEILPKFSTLTDISINQRLFWFSVRFQKYKKTLQAVVNDIGGERDHHPFANATRPISDGTNDVFIKSNGGTISAQTIEYAPR